MKFISWNVNGLRACMQKGFASYFQEVDADIFAIQETKMQEGQLHVEFDGYYRFHNPAQRKGYSGVMVWTKQKPLNVTFGLGIEEHDQEGRVVTLEFNQFYFVAVYTPNAKEGLARLPYRMIWEDAFRDYVNQLKQKKSVIICGDLNVAHQEIDLKNPKTNRKNAGFSDEERNKMSELLASGFIDSFRYFYPEETNVYSWWSYRFKAREKNAGWRIDYFLVSDDLQSKLKDAKIHTHVFGSDHCPVELTISFD